MWSGASRHPRRRDGPGREGFLHRNNPHRFAYARPCPRCSRPSPSPVTLLLTDAQAFPACQAKIGEPDRRVVNAAVQAGEEGVELYFLTNDPLAREPSIALHRQRFAWR